MRSKGALDTETSAAKEWQLETGRDIGMRSVEVVNRNGRKEYVVHSVSGNERNKLFMNREGNSFVDASAFSGADSKADSRVVAYSDLNHDGFQDLLVINGNNPHFEVFANRYANRSGGNYIAIKLIGGNEGTPSKEWSNRDGIGAVVRINAGGVERTRELRCGEGFAAQNSSVLIFGLGELTRIEALDIDWPSGKNQRFENIECNQIVRVNERTKQPEITSWKDSFAFPVKKKTRTFNLDKFIVSRDHQLRVFTTVETTCANCCEAVEGFGSLVSETNGLPVAFFGLPTDVNDTDSTIEEYVKSQSPAYDILPLAKNDRTAYKNFVAASMGAGVSPAYMITDAFGRLLYLETDMPTISDVRRLLREATNSSRIEQ